MKEYKKIELTVLKFDTEDVMVGSSGYTLGATIDYGNLQNGGSFFTKAVSLDK